MEREELISTFNGYFENYTRFRNFIQKAEAQRGKFSSAVIEKVITDNEAKSVDEAELIRPLVPQIEEVLLNLAIQLDEINSTKSGADEQMEEMKLQNVIGMLSDEDFESESASLREELDGAEERINDINEVRERFQSALDAWTESAVIAGHDPGVTLADAEPEPEPESESIAEPVPTEMGDDSMDVDVEFDGAAFGDSQESDEAPSSYAAQVNIREDVSAVFGDPEPLEADDGAEIAIEVGGVAEDEGSVDIDFGVDGNDDLDILSDLGEEVEIDLGDDSAAIGVDLEDSASRGPRRALLLHQEGTAEEQIYPITNENITIGRGRDNDVQIKNDSKVSRYHCKIYRRGDHFYIEDNKSSNGSLVNGELITERRLFGGEEIVIGETFFRFRVME